MKKVIKIANLDCAACAAELQEELQAIGGIKEPSVDFVGQRVSLEYENEEALQKAVYAISHFEEVEIVDGNVPKKKERHLKEIISLITALLFFIPALVLELVGGFNPWIAFGLYMAAFLGAGWSVVWKVIVNFPRMFRGGFHPSVLLDENLLMTVASAGAFAILESMEGAIVMILYQIGELLQAIAVGSSRGAIEKLASLKSESAVLVKGDFQTEVDPEQLRPGDVILLRKGDRVSADCRLLGAGTFDTKSVTGEAYYKEASAGDEIFAGCLNAGGAVKAEVLRPASESAVSKILDLVENSAAKKAKPEKFITKFARIYTPIVVAVAVLIAVLPPLFLGMNDGAIWQTWLYRALDVLVISCPCALVISVPLTYFAGVGTLARHGILTKGAVYLDELAKVDRVAFDKTGTLTEGKFSVAAVEGGERVLALAAGAERASSHPLAQAFAGCDAKAAESAEELEGRGIRAVIDGKEVLVGNLRLMRESGVEVVPKESAHLVVYVAEAGKFLGTVEIEDALRQDAATALSELKKAGVKHVSVLTGDTRARAEYVLQPLSVDEICSDLLPEQKAECARTLKANGKLLYVGDGVNDTPVMAESDVSVAMGGLGSDAAIEASDFVLATDRLTSLPKAVKGAKKTRRIVAQNIVFSIVIKVALMALSVAGLLPLWAAVLGDTGVMLLAVLNSMRMRARLK